MGMRNTDGWSVMLEGAGEAMACVTFHTCEMRGVLCSQVPSPCPGEDSAHSQGMPATQRAHEAPKSSLLVTLPIWLGPVPQETENPR